VALAGADGIVTRWDLSDPGTPRALPGSAASHSAIIRAMEFNPIADVLAAASNDQTVALWSPGGRRLAVLQGPTAPIGDIAFSADGSLLAVLDDGGGVTLWDVVDALPVRVDVLPVDGGNRADAIAWSTNGGALYVGRFNATVEIWDVRAPRPMIANPRGAACALTGRGLDEDEWAAAVPERAYRSTC
jgi:WD40 repeat protein